MPRIASTNQRAMLRGGWATAPAASTASLPISGPSASRMFRSASLAIARRGLLGGR